MEERRRSCSEGKHSDDVKARCGVFRQGAYDAGSSNTNLVGGKRHLQGNCGRDDAGALKILVPFWAQCSSLLLLHHFLCQDLELSSSAPSWYDYPVFPMVLRSTALFSTVPDIQTLKQVPLAVHFSYDHDYHFQDDPKLNVLFLRGIDSYLSIT